MKSTVLTEMATFPVPLQTESTLASRSLGLTMRISLVEPNVPSQRLGAATQVLDTMSLKPTFELRREGRG